MILQATLGLTWEIQAECKCFETICSLKRSRGKDDYFLLLIALSTVQSFSFPWNTLLNLGINWCSAHVKVTVFTCDQAMTCSTMCYFATRLISTTASIHQSTPYKWRLFASQKVCLGLGFFESRMHWCMS